MRAKELVTMVDRWRGWATGIHADYLSEVVAIYKPMDTEQHFMAPRQTKRWLVRNKTSMVISRRFALLPHGANVVVVAEQLWSPNAF